MIEIEYKEKEKIDNLYEKIKKIILSKENYPSFKYEKHQHHLYEESEHPGISKDYYNEKGSVEFKNSNEETIIIEINRLHPHRHSGYSGLNGEPCLSAIIYIIKDGKKQILWELKVESGTMYYRAKVTSLEIPREVLLEKEKIEEKQTDENLKGSNQVILENKIKVLDNRILLEELKKAVYNYTVVNQEKKKILLERKKKIDKTVEEIMSNYSVKLEQCDKNIAAAQIKINNLDSLISKYSTFDEKLVGSALKQLMSIIECKDFLYKQVTNILKKRVQGPIDSWDEDEKTKAIIVVNSDKFMSSYNSPSQYESEIDKLVENGNAILLSEQDVYNPNNSITFYTSKNGKIICHAKFGNFDYIKDFIDKMIQFRFQNELEIFTEKDMITCMKNFISEYKQNIIKNYTSKIDEKILHLSL